MSSVNGTCFRDAERYAGRVEVSTLVLLPRSLLRPGETRGHLELQPGRIALAMTAQAGIRTVLVAESRRHRLVRYVVDLMRSGLEQQRIHYPWHVTRHATARFGPRRVPCVPRRRLAEVRVALE